MNPGTRFEPGSKPMARKSLRLPVTLLRVAGGGESAGEGW